MKKSQRYRYEMFVRARDFGIANQKLFPESSTGGKLFAQVTAAVAAVEAHLTARDLARVEARRVKATTRAAVWNYMKTIAHTARRATRDESIPHPFILPARKTAAALLSKARLFIDEAKPREARFVDLGLPPTFISEFAALVEQYQQAVDVRNSGRALREKAQAGIEHALAEGQEVIRNLDVLVVNALRSDAVTLGHWRGARRLEGLVSQAVSGEKTPLTQETPATVAAPVADADAALRRAS